ncbi:MAG: hypothetical protein R6U89_12300 [Dehalococcoidia bacterium]
MLDNNLYNLMEQMTKENQSLWRIKNDYLKDASGCEECQAFWQKMIKDKEEHVEELGKLIKSHMS